MATLKGLGAVWGVGNVSFTGVAISSSEAKFQSLNFDRGASVAKLMTEGGDTIGESYHDQMNSLKVTIIPIGTTIANARTNLATCLPTPGTLITFVDPESTVLDGTNSGKYVVDRASNGRGNTQFATIDLEMHQYVDNDVSATIT